MGEPPRMRVVKGERRAGREEGRAGKVAPQASSAGPDLPPELRRGGLGWLTVTIFLVGAALAGAAVALWRGR